MTLCPADRLGCGSGGKHLDAGLGVATTESRTKSAEIIWNLSYRAHGHRDYAVTVVMAAPRKSA